MHDSLLRNPAVHGMGYGRISALVICFLLLSSSSLAADPVAINPQINPGVEDPDIDASVDEDDASLPRVDIDLTDGTIEEVAQRVLAEMTPLEKVGQLCQVSVYGETLPEKTAEDLRKGRIGSLFYTGSAALTREAKRVAREESRLGLPLLTPRDVIHGFRTVAPIPLGQAASWNPELIEAAAKIAADESRAQGVNWTFAPMLDICRDARWGRIAESLGEDPVLASAISAAMVQGFQQPEVTDAGGVVYRGIAACAKHFAAYGFSEGGRDYNRAQVATSELHNIVLPPFKAACEAGCATFMTGFSSINGVPGTGHYYLLRDVLKGRWGFDGLVVSDWGSVVEMIEHGFAVDRRDAARLALGAGVDMEMATNTYRSHLLGLLEEGLLTEETLDDAVLRVLRVKLQFALRDDPTPKIDRDEALASTRELARQSCVLLKNDGGVLPLDKERVAKVALIGPLADSARDQLGCWMLDGDPAEAVTVFGALRDALGDPAKVTLTPALESSVDASTEGLDAARAAAEAADVAVVCVGEGWWLSGEARCRADIDLPGAQRALIRTVAETGKPLVLVVLAGRPLTIGAEAELADAVLYAWHPGTMGGPAIADLLLGVESPSGKLPVTFPKRVGQTPLYYNHPNTGRPALPQTRALFGSGQADFAEEEKYRSHYLDVDPFPLYPFGYGLSYTTFEYGEPELSSPVIQPGQTIVVRTPLKNTGKVEADEVVQLYVRDVVASLVQPVRELKAFRRVRLKPDESTVVEFVLSAQDLGYYDNEARFVTEPGEFLFGVGGDSTAPLTTTLTLRQPGVATDLHHGTRPSP